MLLYNLALLTMRLLHSRFGGSHVCLIMLNKYEVQRILSKLAAMSCVERDCCALSLVSLSSPAKVSAVCVFFI